MQYEDQPRPITEQVDVNGQRYNVMVQPAAAGQNGGPATMQDFARNFAARNRPPWEDG
ncbi:MAG TPA: hypothetical protein VGM37_17235 [Armatimonadota bacterium]|jgi:hypothetical protein